MEKEDFIILDYGAMIDKDEAKTELAEVNQKEAEVKADAKKNGESCYL
jgi:hypothetical protein